MVKPEVRRVKIRTPISTPTMEPDPPFMLTPPNTAAVMDCRP